MIVARDSRIIAIHIDRDPRSACLAILANYRRWRWMRLRLLRRWPTAHQILGDQHGGDFLHIRLGFVQRWPSSGGTRLEVVVLAGQHFRRGCRCCVQADRTMGGCWMNDAICVGVALEKKKEEKI